MLYLCATPIGNLGDLTRRAEEALSACDTVFCEDTRRTLQLMNHLGIRKPLISCHEHNECAAAEKLCAMLEEGRDIVYVSDAGMPGISDPGAALVSACIRRGLSYTVLPGASAVVMAAVLCGYDCAGFSFYGFLPRDNKSRAKILHKIRCCQQLAILYESPHRVQATLKLLLEELGDCPGAVLRELTKKFETVERGQLSQLIAKYETEPKGECVICVVCPQQEDAFPDESQLEPVLRSAIENGLSVKDAAAEAAMKLHISKKRAYQQALQIKESMEHA